MLFGYYTTISLEYHPLLAVWNWLSSIYWATLDIWRQTSLSQSEASHAFMTRDPSCNIRNAKYLLPFTQRACYLKHKYSLETKGVVFSVVTKCSLQTSQYFGGICSLRLQGWKISEARNQQEQAASYAQLANTYFLLRLLFDTKKR